MEEEAEKLRKVCVSIKENGYSFVAVEIRNVYFSRWTVKNSFFIQIFIFYSKSSKNGSNLACVFFI